MAGDTSTNGADPPRIGLLTTLRFAVRLCLRASPAQFAVMSAFSLVSAAMAPAVVLLSKRLVDDIARSLVQPVTTTHLVQGAVWLGVVTTVQRVVTAIQSNHLGLVQRAVGHDAETAFYEVAASADMGHFDDKDWHDRMARASRDLSSRPGQLVVTVFGLMKNGVGLLGLFGVLVSLHPMLLVLSFVATIPSVFMSRWVNANFRRYLVDMTEALRKKYYVGSLLADRAAAKEVRSFDVAGELLRRREDLEDTVRTRFRHVTLTTHWGMVASSLVWGAAFAAAYAFVAVEASDGRFSPGSIVAVITAYTAVTTFMGDFLGYVSQLDQTNALFLRDYFSFLDTPRLLPVAEAPARLPDRLDEGLRLDHVSFTYPTGTGPALDDVSFQVRPGELLALVGDNGAGKTTIVKLLERFYLPDAGTVSIGGVDLRDADPADVRSRIGVLFQDFVTYQFSARDNIALGAVDHAGDDERLTAALRAARADTVVAKLEHGVDTPVGSQFGGHDLSGGEWQRLALARLMFRGADIWILDEPTSALDPEAEAAIFSELRSQLQGRIGVVISHRFSTVRVADVIAVLSDGRLVEYGSHEDLLALNGRYAHLFELQAAGYR